MHPQTIAAGWRLAAKLAKAELEKAATRETNEEKFRERLMEIARTTLSSKLVLYEKEHFAKLAVDAVLRLKGSDNLDYIQLLKKPGGQLGDSYLAEGFVLDKKIGIGQPKRLEKAKVMVEPMDTDKMQDLWRARQGRFFIQSGGDRAGAQCIKVSLLAILSHRHRRDAGAMA